MRPVKNVTGFALLLPQDNIDTDQIIPARFLRKPRSVGYHRYMLHDLRYHLDGTTTYTSRRLADSRRNGTMSYLDCRPQFWLWIL